MGAKSALIALLLGGCASERFLVTVEQEGVAYFDRSACHRDRGDADGVRIPVGTGLEVVDTDWSGKSFPCFEASYQGRSVFLTSALFRVASATAPAR